MAYLKSLSESSCRIQLYATTSPRLGEVNLFPCYYVMTHAVRFHLLVMGLKLMLCYMQGLRTVIIEY